MANKQYSPEQAVAKMRQIDVLVGEGRSIYQACKEAGITDFTYYRWRKGYGGLRGDQARWRGVAVRGSLARPLPSVGAMARAVSKTRVAASLGMSILSVEQSVEISGSGSSTASHSRRRLILSNCL